MGGMRVLPVIALAGCSRIFGLDLPSSTVDADMPGSGLLDPPSGIERCPAAPDFESWTYAPHAISGIAAVLHPTFTGVGRVVFGYQGSLYEGGLDGGAEKIASLDLGDGAMLMNSSSAPGGDVIWFLRFTPTGGGIFYAVRTGATWAQHVADFGLLGYQIQPGPAAFHAGSVRMVIGFQPTQSSAFGLVELSSPDGTSWTALSTLGFTTGDDDFDPALSPDGCFVLYSHRSVDVRVLYVSARGSDGNFGPPIELATASATFTDQVQPAIDPTGQRVWFNDSGGLEQATR